MRTITGKALDLRLVHVWDVRDGKVTRFRHSADTARFLEVVSAHPSIQYAPAPGA